MVRLLENETRGSRANLTFPEKSGDGPPVDLRLNLGSQHYAFEHTQIEAFAGQIHTGEEFGQFILPIKNELSGTLPGPAVYHLYFPVNTRLNVNRRRLEAIGRDFVAWVREGAQRLHDLHPERPTRERNPMGFRDDIREAPPGFPYEVMIRREAHWALSTRHNGVLTVTRFAPEDVEDRRVARLRRALGDKCPKLQRCKADGARTVLILEDSDIALSNHVLIGDGLSGLMEERDDLPDEIFLIETAIDRWDLRRLKHDGTILSGEDWAEFDSADLVDMTGAANG